MGEIPVYSATLLAASDLSAKQFYAVKVDSSGTLALAGAGENALGILQNDPTSGQAGNLMIVGHSLAIYGGTVTAGQNLMANSSGQLITHTGTNAVIAVAIESGVSGDIKTISLVTRTGAGLSTTYSIMTIPVTNANIADGDFLTTFTPGFAGSILSIAYCVGTPVTTASKLSTINLEIGTTDVTGGVISLTSAAMTPLGAVIAGTAITANNTFTDSDTISIEASSTTTFTEGDGYFLIVLSS